MYAECVGVRTATAVIGGEGGGRPRLLSVMNTTRICRIRIRICREGRLQTLEEGGTTQ